MAEKDEQKTFVRWFGVQYPKHKERLVMSANGAHLAGNEAQKAKQMNSMKSQGFKRGDPDLFLALPMCGYHGLYIEMKDKGKTLCSLSKDQKKRLLLHAEVGYLAQWAPGFEAAKKIIEEYMSGEYNNKNFSL